MRFVETDDLRLSAVGLGTWQFGSREWGYGSDYAEQVAPAIVEASLAAGVTLFDTAEIYGRGRSERILGRALAGRRDGAVVASKLFPILPIDPVVTHRVTGSARRLGVETIDLYQVHFRNPVVPLGPTMAALGRVVAEGLVDHVGVSNFSLADWLTAEELLGGPVATNQVRYSLVDRRVEADVLPWAQANGRVIMAYSPLGQGLLSGRYDVDHRPKGLRGSTSAFLPENLRRAAPLLEVLAQVAAAHRATPSQIALAWLLRRPHVVVIPGASSVAQAEANAAAADLELTDDEDAALTSASDDYHPLEGRQVLGPSVRFRAGRVTGRARRVAEGLRA